MIFREPVGISDYQAIADLHRLTTRDWVPAEQLFAEETHAAPSTRARRIVAVTAHGRIVGTSVLQQAPWMAARHYGLAIAVAPDCRRHGIGAQLYEDAIAQANTWGLHRITTTLRDDQLAEAHAFAEHRGFTLRQHWVYWALPLQTFNEQPFLPVFTRTQAHHIRFTTFAEASATSEVQQKLYQLNRQTSLDAPGEDSFPTFEAFVRDIIEAEWFRPAGQLLAVDGDRWVGLVAVSLDGERAWNAFTGVAHSHRRRGIALALTLRAIRYAKQQHATQLHVYNDSRNTPMFNLQAQLGYHRTVGRYIMERSFD